LQEDPRERALFRVLVRLELEDDAGSGNTFHEKIRASLVQILKAAQRSGDLPSPWTPASAALLLNALLHGFITQWARGTDDFALVPDAEDTVRILLNSWRKTPRAGSLKVARRR
jgi:hypothetical protein